MTPLLPWAACASASPPAQLWAHGNNLLLSFEDLLPGECPAFLNSFALQLFFQGAPWISPLKKPKSSLQMTNAAVLWIFLLASLRIKISIFPWSLCPRQPPPITPPAVLSCSQTAGSVDASPGWLPHQLCQGALSCTLLPPFPISSNSCLTILRCFHGSNISITLLSLLLHKSPSLLSLREKTKGHLYHLVSQILGCWPQASLGLSLPPSNLV